MSNIVQDCLDMLEGMRADQNRINRENAWREAARFVYPQSPMSLVGGYWPTAGETQTTAARQSGAIYDSTPITTARQLTNGIVSLLTPSTSYWHDLILSGADLEDMDDIERWLEKVRDYLFRVRYNPASGFGRANQVAIRQTVVFGNGIYRVLPHHSNKKTHPFVYRHLPLNSTYVAVTAAGVHDTTVEVRMLTAVQAVKEWGADSLSTKIVEAANDAENTEQYEFLHIVKPRDERGSSGMIRTNKNSEYASYIIDVAGKLMIEESGFYEFPDVKYGWEDEPGEAYSTGPVEMILSTIKQQNSIAKSMLIGGQSTVEPAYLTPANPVTGIGQQGLPRLDTSPNAMNPGYLDNMGRPLAVPFNAVKDPSWAQGLLADGRQTIREGLFMHLFQVLQNNPQQSATEALIKEQEKGELLGPVGQSIQSGLSTLVSREIGIMNRNGVFDAELLPPRDVGEIEISPEYTSPLDNARKAGQVIGMQRTLELAMPMAEVDPTVMANFDFNEMLRTSAQILGAPRKSLRTEKERDAIIEQQQQQQQMQEAMAMAEQAGMAGQALGGAVQQGADATQGVAGAAPAVQEIAGLLGGGQQEEQPAEESGMIDLNPADFEEVNA